MKQVPAMLAALLAAVPALAQGGASKGEGELRKIIQDRVDLYKKTVGIAVGLVNEKGTRVVSYGKTARESGRDVNADTVFEIGSVTKVFTAILLAGMVERGEVSLNDPLSKYLPKTVKA